MKIDVRHPQPYMLNKTYHCENKSLWWSLKTFPTMLTKKCRVLVSNIFLLSRFRLTGILILTANSWKRIPNSDNVIFNSLFSSIATFCGAFRSSFIYIPKKNQLKSVWNSSKFKDCFLGSGKQYRKKNLTIWEKEENCKNRETSTAYPYSELFWSVFSLNARKYGPE